MTDNEIIKALECCFTNEDCSLCPLFRKCPTSFKLEQYALDLITRQQAEIERLKECPKCVYEYDGEVTEYCIQGPCPNFKPVYVSADLAIKQIKNEAYKEFAERLKKETLSDRGYDILQQGTIDNLLKEMVGEEE